MHGVRARRRIRAVRGLESQHSAKFDEAWPLPSIFAGDSKLQKVNAMLEKVGTLQVSGTGKVRVMPDEAHTAAAPPFASSSDSPRHSSCGSKK